MIGTLFFNGRSLYNNSILIKTNENITEVGGEEATIDLTRLFMSTLR